MEKNNEKLELSEKEIREIIEMLENSSYDDYYETSWDDKVTYICVNEDSDGCSAYYGFDEDGPRHSVSSPYEKHKLAVGDYVIEFTNYGNDEINDLKIFKNNVCALPEGNLQDNLACFMQEIANREDGNYVFKFTKCEGDIIKDLKISSICEKTISNDNLKDDLVSAIQEIVDTEVEFPDGDDQFDADWTEEEIIEEIENQLEADEYIEVDGTIYPADDWEEIVERFFEGEEPDEDSYKKLDKHEVAKYLADGIDIGGW